MRKERTLTAFRFQKSIKVVETCEFLQAPLDPKTRDQNVLERSGALPCRIIMRVLPRQRFLMPLMTTMPSPEDGFSALTTNSIKVQIAR
jgi:hypothetical protein